MADFPADLKKAIQFFAFQLETAAFPLSSSDVSVQCAKLLRLIALAAWREGSDSPYASVASVESATSILRQAGPCYASIIVISSRTTAALRIAPSRKAASTALSDLITRTTSSRVGLVDNIVSVLAGGPVRRSIMIQATTTRIPGTVEKAVREAAADMDRLNIHVVGARRDDPDAIKTASRLRGCDGVGDVAVVPISRVPEAFRESRIHGVILDAIAVAAGGVCVVRSGAAVIAASARAENVRVFSCAVDEDILIGCTISAGDAAECVDALKAARGHPGVVMRYKDSIRADCDVRVLNPLWDFVKRSDVLITNVRSLAPSAVDFVA